MKRWEWFIALVEFNADQAVECGLRKEPWRSRVVSVARAEVADAGEYSALIPRLSTADRAAWQDYRKSVSHDVAKLYGMPCTEFSEMPLLQTYDAAVRGEGPIPVPPL